MDDATEEKLIKAINEAKESLESKVICHGINN